EHAYAIVEDGRWLTDDNEPMTDTHEGQEVSVGTAVDCNRPALRVDGVDTPEGGKATVHATFVSARSAAKVDTATLQATPARGGPALAVSSVDPDRGVISFDVSGLKRGKYTYTLRAKDTSGIDAEDARATIWIDSSSGKEPWDPRDAIVYQVVLDR